MRLSSVVLSCLVIACHATPRPTPSGSVTEYRGGQWYDGRAFVPRTMWVVDGRFAATRPDHVDKVIDLAHGFVVPPYAEGHNHWLEPALVDTYVAAHLRQGIFYVRDLSTPPAFHDAIRSKVNRPDSVDYVAAHQGFTGPGGHPLELVQQLAGFGLVPKEWLTPDGLHNAVFVVEKDDDVTRRWPAVIASQPDLVKVFLIHSEDYAKRRDDVALAPKDRGLDPDLVAGIVQRAHAAKLRVVAHIASAHDFHVAIAAGADDIAHLPFVEGNDLARYRLADADLRAAGARHVTIATTLEWLGDAKPGDPRLAVVRDNLARLRAAGVRIVIGTDLFRQTARGEVDRIARLGLMSAAELLHAWTIDTPRAIFPGRDIGRLDTGAEASFLVLAGDPLADVASTARIVRWVKQGRELTPAAIEMPAM